MTGWWTDLVRIYGGAVLGNGIRQLEEPDKLIYKLDSTCKLEDSAFIQRLYSRSELLGHNSLMLVLYTGSLGT